MTTKMSARDKLRGTVMQKRGKSKVIDFRGGKVEVRQPPLEAILDAREEAKSDTKAAIISSIINYVYVPDTEEKLFEIADKDSILKFEFDDGMVALQNTISELTGINIEEETKNSVETPSDEPSSE